MAIFLRVFAYCRRYPFFAFGTLACAIFSTLMGMVYPKLTGIIINELPRGIEPWTLFWMVGGLLAAFALRDGFNSLRIRLNNTFEQNVIFDLRSDLYAAMQRLPVGWFDQQATGDLMTRVNDDVTSVERVLVDGIEQGIVAILQLVGVAVVLFWVNPGLAWWVLAPLPFLVVGALTYTLTAHKRYQLQRKTASALSSLLLDNLQGIRQIKSFAHEDRELKSFREKANDVRTATLKVMRAWATYSPSMTFLAAVGMALVLYHGGVDVLRGGDFRVGDLVTFLLYTAMFYDPVERLHMLNQLVQSGRAAGERVFRILDTPQEIDPEKPLSLPPVTGNGRAISYRNVSLEYRKDLKVLQDINLEIQPGMTVALVGPTGAGKTSVVNLLTRFYSVSRGQILIDGVRVEDVSLKELRGQIGVVSQEAFLFNGSIRENLIFGNPAAQEHQLQQCLEAANAWEFVQALPEKIDTQVGERGVKLSVGEKQRLSIARALLKDPPILILDEATASVDTATERLIQQALDRLLKGRTSIVIAHRLSTVRQAHQICVMRHGKIIEQGKHEELLALGGLYEQLCRAQGAAGTIEETFHALHTDESDAA